jgi:hypothetical protein
MHPIVPCQRPSNPTATEPVAPSAPSLRRTTKTALGAALIVTLLAGCDNVNWGGAQVAVVAPPPKGTATPVAAAGPAEERPPAGPVLYYVQAQGDGLGTLIPVAEIARDTLHAVRANADWELYDQRFIANQLRQGSEFTLFRGGERAGTFVLQTAAIPPETVCPRTPRATGLLELTPGNEQVKEFLALSKTHTPPVGKRRGGPALEADRRMLQVAPILAEWLLRARRVPLPNNWSRAMAQVKPFPLAGNANPAFASTFLVGDTLGRGSGHADGYALFFIAQPAPQAGYDTVYVDFVPYPEKGKAAPRVIDFLDWNQDGEPGLLLEVYGPQDAWFEAVGRSGGRWRRLLQTRCDRPPADTTEQVAEQGKEQKKK